MKKLFGFVSAVLVVCLCVGMLSMGNEIFQASIATKILRFHVLANSDEKIDQDLKLKVRDEVGAYLQPLLEDSKSLDETKSIVNENYDAIINVAQEIIRENGYDYEVSAYITNVMFPEKRYGDYVFPAGNYEALQIVIGEGEGQNWWCVLYPNMCFRGSVYEVIEEDAHEALKEVLNPLEYASVFDSGKVEVRFKFLEYFVD